MFCPKCGTENPETGRFCRSCGTDLGNVSSALSGELKPSRPSTYVDHKGRVRSNEPSDIISHAIRNSVMGIGFLVIAAVLYFTGVAGGHSWWWAMLFPGFSMLASGFSQFVKYGAMGEKKTTATYQPTLNNNQFPQSLPPNQTEFVKPQASIYDTGELVVPPSVTENTTRHLEMNSEGETMTLPKK